MKNLIFVALGLFCFSLGAKADNSVEDVKRDWSLLKSFLAPGEEMAETYKLGVSAQTNENIVFKRKGDELFGSIASSYVKADFNRDGQMDIALVVENAPGTSQNQDTLFGDRTLKIFLAQAGGAFRLLSESSKVILRGDEGGMMGDPFLGITLNSRGSLVVEHYGGSRDRWGIKQTFQVRADDVYLAGQTNEEYDTLNGDQKIVDTNFLSRVRITSVTKNERRKVRREKNLQIKPIKMSEVKGLWD